MRKPEPPAAPQEENIGTIELERLPSPQPPGPHPPGIKETPPDGRPGEPPPGQKPHPPAVPKPPRGHIEHSEQIEEENAQLVISFENKQGRDAVDRRKEQGLGYDLESTDRVTGEKRYIELKGHSHVELTPNEHRRALDLGPSYFLYVVGGDLLSVIRDPCRACQVKETPRIEIRYAMVNWAQVGERFKVHRVSR